MTTITKIIISIVMFFLLMSCEFNMSTGIGTKGNGHVIKTERTLNGDFDEISTSRGIEVYLTQSNQEGITVEADENLHEIIITEIENKVLKIYADDNIRSSKSQKVYVSFKDISKIKATSGSDVFSTNTIALNELDLSTTSGGEIELDVNTQSLECHSTSGSEINLSGKTNSLIAHATSGSDIDAGDLNAITSRVKATSGAGITVNTSKELIAKATSGGDITYYGNPEKLETSDGVSGSIGKR